MSSSTNRFALLSNDPSSSKEQETQGPVTGKQDRDQSMRDADRAGFSAERQGLLVESLQASLPNEPTKAEKLEVLKRIAALLEPDIKREKEEDRRKNSRQGNSSTVVGKPIPTAAPSQGPRKRTAPFNGAKESSKRRREEPPSPSQSGEPAIAAPTTVSEIKTEEPDVATQTTPSAPALLVPEAAILSTSIPFRWTDIRNPRKPLLCIIQVNSSSRVGSFAENTNEWAFQVTFDAGRRGTPKMNMNILSNGIAGPQRG